MEETARLRWFPDGGGTSLRYRRVRLETLSRTTRFLKVVMLAATVGPSSTSFYHLQGNLWIQAGHCSEAPLLSCVVPLLAPGGIALRALVAALATCRHPATARLHPGKG